MENYKKRLYDIYVSGGQADRAGCEVFACDTALYEWLVKKFMPKDKYLGVLDLACGNGVLLTVLKRRGYLNIKGVDISPEQIELARKTGVGDVCRAEIGEYLKNNTEQYDVIFLVNILEHMGKQELMDKLDLISKALKPGGKFIIVVPNGAGMFGMFALYGDFTHENCFTENSMRQILHAAGFDNIGAFEIPPIVHGVKSFVRYILWQIFSIIPRLMLITESGRVKQQITQNMVVTAKKK